MTIPLWTRGLSPYCLLITALSAMVAAAEPAPIPFKPDRVVAADGSGGFKTIQAALESIAKDNRERMVVLVKDGVYHEKIRIDPNFVTLRGESREGTRIEFPQPAEGRRNDDIGIAVANINGNDVVLQNLTVRNTDNQIGPHAFAVFGTGDKTVIEDADILSQGADTLSLWSRSRGRYYHARLKVCGSVDFICPRGWCYMTDSVITQVNPKAEAAIWHDGSADQAMKFVLTKCTFDGPPDWILSRHHHDAQFYLLDCRFSAAMRDLPPHRVVYPLDGSKPTQKDVLRNQAADSTNRWGERAYFYDCHREGGDYAWLHDNLSEAPGSPKPSQITAAWTFDGSWDPESKAEPALHSVTAQDGQIDLEFAEAVSVKGKPSIVLDSGAKAEYQSGSGGRHVIFASAHEGKPVKFDGESGTILASGAGATLRVLHSGALLR